QADMWDWSRERLAAAGYEHYEISNWARPGEECRHNVVYWRNGDWLGLGPGAHSHLAGVRFADVYSPTQYVRKVDEAATLDLPSDSREMIRAMPQVTFVDELSLELQMADTAILALRLHDGLDVADFERRYGKPVEAQFGEQIAEFTSLGFLERADGRVRLTDRGRYVANEVFLKLLPDD
ncbi:MAG: coproporphyrinogen III oxidase family protein, partial [Chloroflexota bacterium]